MEFVGASGPNTKPGTIDKRLRRWTVVYNDAQYESVKLSFLKPGIYLDEVKPSWGDLKEHGLIKRLYYWLGARIFIPLAIFGTYLFGHFDTISRIGKWLIRLIWNK